MVNIGRILAAVALVVVVTPGRAAAGPPGRALIDSDGATFSWAGSFVYGATQFPALCGSCDELALDIDLPAGTWDRPGGVQVSVQWPRLGLDADLDLFVYGPDGALVASGEGYISYDESVRIPHAANGRYRVVVMARSVAGELPYRGAIHVEHTPPAEPLRDVLPDAVALPPSGFHLDTGVMAHDLSTGSATGGCYAGEMADQGARRCLRFDQRIANIGDGPLELRGRGEDLTLGSKHWTQRVYRSDGTFFERPGPGAEFHASHGHFHVVPYVETRLYALNTDGSKGELVRTNHKSGTGGSCMADLFNVRFGQPGEWPRTYAFGSCRIPYETQNGIWVAALAPGWGDEYPWWFADTFLEVSGVPDGDYALELEVNVTREVLETDPANNVATTRLHLEGDRVWELS